MIVSLWSREKLADDSGVAASGPGWGGFTLGYAVGRSRGGRRRVRRGRRGWARRITSTPRDKGFGYSGVFADPDGHTWEVALVDALVRHDDGTVELPS